MRNALLALALLAALGGGVMVAAAHGDGSPATDPTRADCPGLIRCPLTGEMVCADECPLASKSKDQATPPCCQAK